MTMLLKAIKMRVRQTREREVPHLGRKIKEAREKDPRSLTDICQLVGMTTSNWYRIEKEETKVLPEETLRSIEKVLNINFGVNFDE